MFNEIRGKHENDNITFWPYSASSHYAKKLYLFCANPPNIPKTTSIEVFGIYWVKIYERIGGKLELPKN